MAESKVKRENYICLHGWMLTDLGLKGNELIIYACIYGFSQAENQVFNGSLQYLADWTNSTKQGVMKCLKSLVEKGYIVKTDKMINGVKFCEYYATELHGVLNKVAQGMQQSCIGGIKQSCPNNIVSDNTEDTKEIEKDIYTQVIDHLNEKAGTKYRATTPKTQTVIRARLAEGFTLDDFKTVIDKQCAAWRNTQWEKYLRPETLFGTKFEGYLNAKGRMNNGTSDNGCASTDSAEIAQRIGTYI